MAAAWRSVSQRLPPVARAAMTSCCVMTAGDLICQNIQHRRRRQSPSAPSAHVVDWERARTFGIVGLTLHGPFFFYGFRWLDSSMGPAQSLFNALRKTLTGQCTLFPTYLCLFFTAVGLLEGRSPQQCVEKIQAMFIPTFASGSVFWPIVNVINFRFVPATHRVLYVNAMGLLWNVFLSYMTTKETAVASAASLLTAADTHKQR